MEPNLSQARIEADLFTLVGTYYKYFLDIYCFGKNDIVGIYGLIQQYEYLFSKQTYDYLSEIAPDLESTPAVLYRNRILRK